MPIAQNSMEQLLGDIAIDGALAATGRMFGVPEDAVAALLRVELPMLAQTADLNPELLRRLYAMSRLSMPAPPQEFYIRMVESRAVRQSAMDDYRATFGGMLDTIHREAAKQVNLTDGQAREIFAAALPALNRSLAKANVEGTEAGFQRQLQTLCPQSERTASL